MPDRRGLVRWIGGLLISAIFAAGTAQAEDRTPLTIFAAASLTESMQAAGREFTARIGTPVRFSFASSAGLARQLEAGAPADMFVSADGEWMDYVEQRGLIDPRSRANLLQGELVLIAPAEGATRLPIRRGFPIAAALGPNGRLATGDPDSVPVGRYAKASLISLGVWDAVSGRLARAENSRQALALVARNEAPLGIVYLTDALVERRVRVVGVFGARTHPRILYPAALMRNKRPSAATFLRFLQSDAGRKIFHRYGFRTVR